MLAFYVEQRVERCRLSEDEDMLLFQWGTFDWQQGQGPQFEVDITRQIVFPDDEENDDLEEGEEAYSTTWQLSWTYRYALDSALKALGTGDRWCRTPKSLPGFERFMTQSKVLDTVAGLTPRSVDLRFEAV